MVKKIKKHKKLILKIGSPNWLKKWMNYVLKFIDDEKKLRNETAENNKSMTPERLLLIVDIK